MRVTGVLTLLLVVQALADDSCTEDLCKGPNCRCAASLPPDGLKPEETPQFVMLTFDDAVNVVNFRTYQELLNSRKNKRNNCSIAATFFVSHEYADYQLIHQLYRSGSEIAVHTITHEPDTTIWREADEDRWRNELQGMRKILSTFAKIPEEKITGFRAPFLQTAGDITFKVLKEEKFTYDSSMPTLEHTSTPIWPYTLDHGYQQHCQITPCPEGTFQGLWIVPLVNYIGLGKRPLPCSMADACVPYPTTANDTYTYLMNNFLRHYDNGRAPFPVFLHEAWLRDPERKKGYFQFVDDLLDMDDVFIVNIQEVIDYMHNPQPIDEYEQGNCFQAPLEDKCRTSKNCKLKHPFWDSIRYMRVCQAKCPKTYPWLENPLGSAPVLGSS